MLSDPITLAYQFTPGTPTGGVASAYNRTDKGRFLCSNGAFSLDQPSRLTITPKVKLMGPSTYRSRLEIDRNVAPVNGIQQMDDTAFCEINFGGNLRSFSNADFTNLVNGLALIVTNNLTRILEGQS